MKLLLMGIQGSGKGTQARLLVENLKIAHISTGDLFRSATGQIKEELDSYMNKGILVPDELTLKILKERLANDDCKNGFILDGFPRNISQAKELDKITKIDYVVEISISDEEALKRLAGRINCKKCGAVYNLTTAAIPKVEGICDKCGEHLYQRKDDVSKEAVERRLKSYHEEVAPMMKYYKSIKIDGEQTIDKVFQDVLNALGKK